MTQFSWPWECTNTGDGGSGSFSLEVVRITNAMGVNLGQATDGVVYWTDATVLPFTGFSNASDGLLAITNPAGNTIRIASGLGVVQGWMYANDANVDFDCSTVDGSPAGGAAPINSTNLVVLRRDLAGQTVRLAYKTAAAPGGTATVTQTAATWEVAIATVVLDGSSNFSSLTDTRTASHPPGGSMTKISETLLNSASRPITFNNIPPMWTHLRVVLHARLDAGSGNENTIRVFLNNDTGGNYSWLSIVSNTGATTVTASATSTNFPPGNIVGTGGLANAADDRIIDIFNYKNTTYFTSIQSVGNNTGLGAAGDLDHISVSGQWKSTAAVTRVDVDSTTGLLDFSAGSIFTLYGVV